MAHQIFVCVAKDVVPLSAVFSEIKFRAVENRNKVRQAIDHLLAGAKLLGIVKVGDINHALKVVRLGEFRDDDVDLFADLLIATERHHVGEAAAFRDFDQTIGIAGIFVGDVFHEQQNEDVILILGGIHAAAKRVAAGPKRTIDF